MWCQDRSAGILPRLWAVRQRITCEFHQYKKYFSDQHLPHRLWGPSSLQSVQEGLRERASKTTTHLRLCTKVRMRANIIALSVISSWCSA